MEIEQFNPTQKEGLQAIIDGCARYLVTDKRMVAYILATAYWESGETMQPVEEIGKGAGHRYGSMFKQSGEPYTTPPFLYYGRGLVQVTFYENYEMLQNQSYAIAQGWKFLTDPTLLLEMEPSVWAMVHCMYHGSFTGVGLPKYFNAQVTDPLNARRIVNGTDQADRIAGFYEELLAFLG